MNASWHLGKHYNCYISDEWMLHLHRGLSPRTLSTQPFLCHRHLQAHFLNLKYEVCWNKVCPLFLSRISVSCILQLVFHCLQVLATVHRMFSWESVSVLKWLNWFLFLQCTAYDYDSVCFCYLLSVQTQLLEHYTFKLSPTTVLAFFGHQGADFTTTYEV
jgi:hypothetical protein